MMRRASEALLGLFLLGVASTASGQTASADRAEPGLLAAQPGAKPVPWHDSSVLWSQRVGTQTLGVGGDYQSRDPYYDWVFYLRPRYYFWEDGRSSLSVRGQLWADMELTNSDVTTRRKQLMAEDTLLAFTPQHAFVLDGDYFTDLTLSLPRLVLPTSPASYRAGNIVQLGVRAFLLQGVPLRQGEPLLPRAHVGLRAGYSYQFTRSVVPELSTLNQVRMDLEGRSVSNDQLSGAALPEHLFILHGILGADLWRDVFAFESELGLDPAVKFALPAGCVTIRTGCVAPEQVSDPQRKAVLTLLDAWLELRSFRGALKTSLGYENITNQLAPESRRRSVFWSPDAKFYLRFEFQPDLLFEPPAATAELGPARQVATGR